MEFSRESFRGKPIDLLMVYGSLVRGNFGRYSGRNKWGELYSDVDIGIITRKKFRMPPGWRRQKTYLSCYSYVYRKKVMGRHPIRVKIFNTGVHDARDEISLRLPINRKIDKKKEMVVFSSKNL